MNETPRTDANTIRVIGAPDGGWEQDDHPDGNLVDAEFARELERENAKLREALQGMVDNACAACDENYVIRATKKEWDAHVAATNQACAALARDEERK